LAPDPLQAVVKTRSVQRRPMQTQRLSAAQKQALEAAIGADYAVDWLERTADRLKVAKMLFHSAKIRLTIPE
ncbi:hypothetical protein, partial [Klebsiella pneumoniae]|uniref:hypothetical protein n=1 Tax=Klebsiella pneumoniae TaxID=573 RepID=UPI001953659D